MGRADIQKTYLYGKWIWATPSIELPRHEKRHAGDILRRLRWPPMRYTVIFITRLRMIRLQLQLRLGCVSSSSTVPNSQSSIGDLDMESMSETAPDAHKQFSNVRAQGIFRKPHSPL